MLLEKQVLLHYLKYFISLLVRVGVGVGVLDGTKANSAPNLVGVGAGAELGNTKIHKNHLLIISSVPNKSEQSAIPILHATTGI